MRWRAGTALGFLALGVPVAGTSLVARADAAPPTVALLRPATMDPVTSEATARVRGELEAAGFEVVALSRSAEDAKRELETAGGDLHPIAAFAIFVTPAEGGGALAEIWVSDRIRRKTVIQNALFSASDHAREAEILAVRAVELLKASLAEFWAPPEGTASAAGAGTAAATSSAAGTPVRAPGTATATASASAPASASTSAPTHPSRALARAAGTTENARNAGDTGTPALGAGWSVALGIGALQTFGPLGMTWSPWVAAGYGWESGWAVRARVDGLGPAGTLSSASGRAGVEQQLGALEVVRAFWPRAPVVPLVFAGIGAQHLHVVGSTDVPGARGDTSDPWSLLTVFGAGLGVPLLAHLSLLAEGQALAAWPPSIVRIAGQEVGRVGTPSLAIDAAVLGVLP